MSARGVLQTAVLAALTDAGIAAFDAPPVRRAAPFVVVEEPVIGALNAVGVCGRVGTIAVSATDCGQRRRRAAGAAARDAGRGRGGHRGDGVRFARRLADRGIAPGAQPDRARQIGSMGGHERIRGAAVPHRQLTGDETWQSKRVRRFC